jgi:hypothetical protein
MTRSKTESETINYEPKGSGEKNLHHLCASTIENFQFLIPDS